MIKWREGKAGFVGGSKRFIKGFFDFSFTLTSEDAITPTSSFGVNSLISEHGQGVVGIINAQGQGVSGTIYESIGISSIIESKGQGVVGEIDENGQGVEGNLN